MKLFIPVLFSDNSGKFCTSPSKILAAITGFGKLFNCEICEQTVTVTGVDDALVDGNQQATITVSINAAATDDAFDNVIFKTVNVIIEDNDTPDIRITSGDLSVSENGTTANLTVVLSAQPNSNVFINLSSNDEEEATVAPTSLTFTTDNWNNEQTAIVTGINDELLDGNQNAIITLSIDDANSDDAFDNVINRYESIVVTDNNTPDFTVSETDLFVDESGTAQTFDVVLTAAPTSDVVFILSSDATDEASVSPTTITFTAANWNSPQTVNVTGVNDLLLDGTQSANITVAVDAATSDDDFDDLTSKKVSVSVEDNDTPDFTVSETTLFVDENGSTQTFEVLLSTAPTSIVVFKLLSDATDEATVSPTTLMFTTANWNSPQTVTITGVNDNLVDGTQTANITVAVDATASDDNFDDLTTKTVMVSVEDNDTPNFTVSETALTVNENGTTQTFEVVLTAAPINDVVFKLESDATDEATVLPATITFTADNWNSPQTATISGVNDNLLDGTQSAIITVAVDAATSDDAFDLLASKTISVSVEGNDLYAFSISRISYWRITTHNASIRCPT